MRKLHRKDITKLHPRAIQIIGHCVQEAIKYAVGDIGDFELLQPCEKSVIGIKLERLILTKLRLPANNKHLLLDTMIRGVPIDIKFSLSQNWAISQPQLGFYALLVSADMPAKTYSVGLIRTRRRYMNNSTTRKFNISKLGRSKIRWLTKNTPFPSVGHESRGPLQQVSAGASDDRRIDHSGNNAASSSFQ
jgi:hypothetical protein